MEENVLWSTYLCRIYSIPGNISITRTTHESKKSNLEQSGVGAFVLMPFPANPSCLPSKNFSAT